MASNVSTLAVPGLNLVDSNGFQYGPKGEMSPEAALQEQSLNRKQQLANLLIQRGLQPNQGQMVGRFYVAPSPVQGLANLASIGAGIYGNQQIDQGRADIAQQDQNVVQQALKAYQQKMAPQSVQVEAQGPGAPMPNPALNPNETPDSAQNFTAAMQGQIPPYVEGAQPTATIQQPASEDSKKQALMDLVANRHPLVQRLGSALMQQEQLKQQAAAQTQEHNIQREFTAAENEKNRDVKREGMESNLNQMVMLKLMTQQQADEIRAKMDQQAELSRKNALEVARIQAGAKTDSAHIRADAAQSKPMPQSAVNAQNEDLELIGGMNAINADLSEFKNQIDKGELQLGPMANLESRGRNYLGISNENSQKFASFKATMEKQRNTSLLLNKGVQTEGDAQRAWNELFENINDPKVVSQRLEEIQRLNERAANIRKLKIDALRENWKQEPFDYSKIEKQPASVGKGTSSIPPVNQKGWKLMQDANGNKAYVSPDGTQHEEVK